MRIKCPICGERDAGEFTYRGDAAPQRPAAPPGGDARKQDAAFFDYIYLRANPDGLIAEHWYHGMGCRSWLIVSRDVRTHRIASVALAGDGLPAAGGKAARGGE